MSPTFLVQINSDYHHFFRQRSTTYTYEPFGRAEVAGTPSANAFRFTGREDDGTGLYYYRARYYDPVRSRFVSADPIGFAAGINFFAYVGDNPTNFADPLGLMVRLQFL